MYQMQGGNNMARPVKFRKVDKLPQYTLFVPMGIKKCKIEEMLVPKKWYVVRKIIFVIDNVINR